MVHIIDADAFIEAVHKREPFNMPKIRGHHDSRNRFVIEYLLTISDDSWYELAVYDAGKWFTKTPYLYGDWGKAFVKVFPVEVVVLTGNQFFALIRYGYSAMVLRRIT